MSRITWLTEPIAQNYEFIVVVALTLIFLVIVVGMCILLRKQRAPLPVFIDTTDLDAVVTRAMSALAHATDVSAVVKLVNQLDEDPGALELLKSYPETVRAAALLHRVNTLGADSQAAHEVLSEANGLSTHSYNNDEKKRARAHVEQVHAELNKAIELCNEANLSRV